MGGGYREPIVESEAHQAARRLQRLSALRRRYRRAWRRADARSIKWTAVVLVLGATVYLVFEPFGVAVWVAWGLAFAVPSSLYVRSRTCLCPACGKPFFGRHQREPETGRVCYSCEASWGYVPGVDDLRPEDEALRDQAARARANWRSARLVLLPVVVVAVVLGTCGLFAHLEDPNNRPAVGSPPTMYTGPIP